MYLSEPLTTDFPRLVLKLFIMTFTLLLWLINYTFACYCHQYGKYRQEEEMMIKSCVKIHH